AFARNQKLGRRFRLRGLLTRPASVTAGVVAVSGCVNSAFSLHFSTFCGPSVQSMDTQLGARQGRRTPTIHRDRAQRTISADSLVVAGWERIVASDRWPVEPK